MKKEKTQFTLKLSREKIQLLLINGQGEFQEIGKADPNDPEITQNLQTLREQVSALSGNCPLVNVMLPDDLILVQNLTIENVNQPITASVSPTIKNENNDSGSNITITQGSNQTMYNAADAATGNRTLAGRGLATVLCFDNNEFVISGAGLS